MYLSIEDSIIHPFQGILKRKYSVGGSGSHSPESIIDDLSAINLHNGNRRPNLFSILKKQQIGSNSGAGSLEDVEFPSSSDGDRCAI